MMRIYLNIERLSLGSTGIAVVQTQWDSVNEKIKGRTTEALSILKLSELILSRLALSYLSV